jgi:hypothetical protein
VGEEIVDAPGKDGNTSTPQQIKRPNPWRRRRKKKMKMMMMMMIFYTSRADKNETIAQLAAVNKN